MRLSLVVLAVAVLPLPWSGAAEKTHREFRTEAEAAYQRKDYAAARTALRAALALRPDSPRYLHNLAAISALTGDRAAALATLRQLVAFGISVPVERDPDFASLQGTPEFQDVLRAFAANRQPHGNVTAVAELPGRTGILEGIAYRARTDELFLSDVHHRCIWRRDRDGRVVRFSAEDDELLGLFGLAIDERRNALWVAMSALPEMAGYTTDQKGQTGLAAFSLTTSELTRVVLVTGDGRPGALGDLAIAADGTVYATDSKVPVIWKLSPGAEEVEKAAESPDFSSLQGIVLIEQTLIVADYSNGLFRVELPGGAVTPLAPPKDTTLLGLDGLVAIPGGLIATQNGVEPQRVLHVRLSADLSRITSVAVLASGQPELTDLTLVTLANDRPTVIAGSGWDLFDATKAKQPPAHPVRILQIELP